MVSTRSVGLEVAAQHLGEVGARIGGVLGGSGQVERGGGRVEIGTHVALVVNRRLWRRLAREVAPLWLSHYPWKCRAIQSRQACPEEVHAPSSGSTKAGRLSFRRCKGAARRPAVVGATLAAPASSPSGTW
eukprot:scaffold91958_cov48-Phaeocystis_antarctica.AAC.3